MRPPCRRSVRAIPSGLGCARSPVRVAKGVFWNPRFAAFTDLSLLRGHGTGSPPVRSTQSAVTRPTSSGARALGTVASRVEMAWAHRLNQRGVLGRTTLWRMLVAADGSGRLCLCLAVEEVASLASVRARSR
jgi:hypothetical protein